MDTPFIDEDCADFLCWRETNVHVDGKQTCGKRDNQSPIEARLKLGVSIAGMTLKAGVSANQLCQDQEIEARLNGASAPR